MDTKIITDQPSLKLTHGNVIRLPMAAVNRVRQGLRAGLQTTLVIDLRTARNARNQRITDMEQLQSLIEDHERVFTVIRRALETLYAKQDAAMLTGTKR